MKPTTKKAKKATPTKKTTPKVKSEESDVDEDQEKDEDIEDKPKANTAKAKKATSKRGKVDVEVKDGNDAEEGKGRRRSGRLSK